MLRFIKPGQLYFVDSFFYEKFDEKNFMLNKEDGDQRPCLVVAADEAFPDIFWCVPLSTQVEKYEDEYNKKTLSGQCTTIMLGEITDLSTGEIKERAFLIQNLFPVSKKYITGYYRKSVATTLYEKARENSQRTVFAHLGGVPLLFMDVLKIYKSLVEEMGEELKNGNLSFSKRTMETFAYGASYQLSGRIKHAVFLQQLLQEQTAKLNLRGQYECGVFGLENIDGSMYIQRRPGMRFGPEVEPFETWHKGSGNDNFNE